jgi:hypothetical protein
MNNIKTAAMLAFMTMLLMLGGQALGVSLGGVLFFAAIFNLGMYFFSDKLAIAASRAKPVTEAELPQVYNIMRRLTQQANMPMPRIYLIDSPQPNAFATGRNPKHAAVGPRALSRRQSRHPHQLDRRHACRRPDDHVPHLHLRWGRTGPGEPAWGHRRDRLADPRPDRRHADQVCDLADP